MNKLSNKKPIQKQKMKIPNHSKSITRLTYYIKIIHNFIILKKQYKEKYYGHDFSLATSVALLSLALQSQQLRPSQQLG